MKITRMEPWSLFDVLQRDLDRMASRRSSTTTAADSEESIADWIPPVDVVEEEARFLLRADVPGVRPEDIDINMENGVLTVSGRRIAESTEQAQGVKRLERLSGTFYRRFSLPEAANADEVSAKCAHGILEIVIPKQPEAKARRITVKAA